MANFPGAACVGPKQQSRQSHQHYTLQVYSQVAKSHEVRWTGRHEGSSHPATEMGSFWLTGVCHLVAKKWEKDEDTTELFTGMTIKTLKEDLLENPASQSALRGRPRGGTSKSVTIL